MRYSDCKIELLNFDEDELLGGIPIRRRPHGSGGRADDPRHPPLRLELIEPASFEFKPGQYADLHIPGTDEHRSFSMATTPSSPGAIEFLIKKYPGGKFSALLGRRGIGSATSCRSPGPTDLHAEGPLAARSSASAAGRGWRPSCRCCGT